MRCGYKCLALRCERRPFDWLAARDERQGTMQHHEPGTTGCFFGLPLPQGSPPVVVPAAHPVGAGLCARGLRTALLHLLGDVLVECLQGTGGGGRTGGTTGGEWGWEGGLRMTCTIGLVVGALALQWQGRGLQRWEHACCAARMRLDTCDAESYVCGAAQMMRMCRQTCTVQQHCTGSPR